MKHQSTKEDYVDMGNIIDFETKKEQFDYEDLLQYKAMLEIQLQAARDFSEPLLLNLAWVNDQLASNEASQLNLPFENNIMEIGNESYLDF